MNVKVLHQIKSEAGCAILKFWYLVSLSILGVLAAGCKDNARPAEVRLEGTPPAIPNTKLWNPSSRLEFAITSDDLGLSYQFAPSGISLETTAGEHSELELIASPQEWNLSNYSAVSVSMRNLGKQLIRVKARLIGDQKRPRRLGYDGSAFLMPGESGSLMIRIFHSPISLIGNEIGPGESQAPSHLTTLAIFPNGRRPRQGMYLANHVNGISLQIESNGGPVSIDHLRVEPLLELKGALSGSLMELPMIDQFGQLKNIGWPGKLGSVETLRERPRWPSSNAKEETLSTKRQFQTECRDGFWWFVDEQGEPFWSLGVTNAGRGSLVQVSDREELFADLPDQSDHRFDSAFVQIDEKEFIDFYYSNLIRRFGPKFRRKLGIRTATRLHDWHVNTLGDGSAEVVRDRFPGPYVATVNSNAIHMDGVGPIPDPFDPSFDQRLDAACQLVARRVLLNGRCLGVCVDNHQVWPDRIVSNAFAKKRSAVRDAFLKHLKEQYTDIAALNTAWQSEFHDWEEVSVTPTMIQDASRQETGSDMSTAHSLLQDCDSLLALFANRYFFRCRLAVNKNLPGKLFLGCQIARFPPVVARACAAHADVFSVKVYSAEPSIDSIPEDLDIPVLISGFQFGSCDRGALGCGNNPMSTQTQRARATAYYLVKALQDRRIVGAHWDAYSDSSAAAMTGDTMHVGMVDITDHPHSELTNIFSQIGNSLVTIRTNQSELPIAVAQHLFTD